MAGFKTFWIPLLSLLLVASCVPKSKQSECSSNEAFNTILRTCVPIVGGPSSFISIDSYYPTTAVSKFRNDTNFMTFKVYIKNPYSQTYYLTWTRIYNGNSYSVTPNPGDSTQWDVAPSTFSSQVGTHLVAVEVKDSSNNVVDSHIFQFNITDLPKPYILSGSVSPTTLDPEFLVDDGIQTFSFNIYNNNATSLSNYESQWRVFRSGVLQTSSNVPFSNTTPTGTHPTSLNFDPAIYGVGSYVVRSRLVHNLSGEVVDEKLWYVLVKYPPIANVVSRSLIQGDPLSWGTTVIAYNGISYPNQTLYNFRPAGYGQANFCVEVADGEGTVTGDGLFVKVSYYLNGTGAPIYEGYTSAVDPEVCLSDAASATLASLVFTNSSSTSTVDHKVTARILDVASNQEYSDANITLGNGTYPLYWNISVRPQNKAPTVAYGAITSNISGCSIGSSSPRTGCTVLSDNDFIVSINLSDDDFDTNGYTYNIRLMKDGVAVSGQSCSFTDPSLGQIGTTYQCTLRVNGYNSSGPFNVATPVYTVEGFITDGGSPILATNMTSSTLVWNLTVNEGNTAPVLSPLTTLTHNGPVNEGSTLSFNASIDDTERDSYDWRIEYSASGAGVVSGILTSGTVNRTNSFLSNYLSVNQVLAQDFLLNSSLGCATTLRNASCTVDFRLIVTDKPDTAMPASLTTSWVPVSIVNINPAPVLNDTLATPDRSTFTSKVAFVGVPLTINASASGVITDASSAAAEGISAHRYQWYSRNSVPSAWTPVDGATAASVVWTPSLSDLGDKTVSLMLCVEDQSFAGTPVAPTSTCNDATPWVVTVRNNIAEAHALTLASNGTETGIETAIWYDSPSTYNGVTSSAAYVAAIGNDNLIHVKKILVRNDGQITAEPATRIVSFAALSSGTVQEVKDLSITGNGTSLYIAYMASTNLSPFSFYPQVRRIDISSGKVTNTANTNAVYHQGKLGFDYDGITITNNCTPTPSDCVITNPADGSAPTVQFAPTATQTGNIQITTPQGTLIINFAAPYDAETEICANCTGATMATNLANVINRNAVALGGISATSATDTVTIQGSLALDFLDTQTGSLSRLADQMGQIYISGTNWYVPFINSSLGGSLNDKISFLSGLIDVNMTLSGGNSLSEPAGGNNLDNLVSTSRFSSQLVGTDLFIALIAKTGSAGTLYKIDPTTFAFTSSQTLFSSAALTDIQVAGSSTYAFVGAKDNSTPFEQKLGIYDNVGLTIREEFDLSNTTNVDNTTNDIFKPASVSSYKIIPYGTEARIIAASNNGGTDYHLYLSRLFSNGTNWNLTCNDCEKVSHVEQEVGEFVKISAAPVRTKVLSSSYRLGSDGFLVNEGIKDVLFTSFGQFDPITPAVVYPQLGIFNMEPEQISSTFIGPLVGTEEDSGFFRPPFIKN